MDTRRCNEPCCGEDALLFQVKCHTHYNDLANKQRSLNESKPINRTIEGVKKDETIISPDGREYHVDEVSSEIVVDVTDPRNGIKMRIPLEKLSKNGFKVKALEGIEEIRMSSETSLRIRELAAKVHSEVHRTPDESHGYTREDVLNSAMLLHAIVMDVAAPYLAEKVGIDEATRMARAWGENLHVQIFDMTGADTYDTVLPEKPEGIEEVKE